MASYILKFFKIKNIKISKLNKLMVNLAEKSKM